MSKFIHFWYDRKMTKFDFSMLRDSLFAISQSHTTASSLSTVNSQRGEILISIEQVRVTGKQKEIQFIR